ncbi:polysaccharide pyruvyl transferase family protein [Vibrio parahaemolyticus]|uniref:polysaccharide pyruvyl transferase family protein n=1 Tax=Vibrio TaxID=662 RepID=UPI00146F3944|nr:polysaccharide pyruvyl transferase family protein [Vibrio parahaemolyticus]MDF5680380.1 polysaccharide pyruvyl transferase family protein [Vibrio parahaemolyticus]NMU10766.1 polysaccharide pyruvyl transferase family protein [Vibrio parahaemolyticus]
MCKIYYRAQTQYENFGDLVINQNLIKMMREKGELVIDTNGVPESYLLGLELNNREVFKGKNFFLKIVKDSLSKKNTVLFFTKPGHVSYKNELSSLVRQTLTAIVYSIMYICGVKICRFGGSIGNETGFARYIEIFKGRLYSKYIVRDSGSFKLAKDKNYKNLDLASDLAFNCECYFDEDKKENYNNILASFRNGPDLSKLKSLINKLNSSYEVDGIIQVDRDLKFMRELFQNKNFDKYLSTSDKFKSQILESYSNNSIAISNRLHVLLLSASYGVVPFAYVNKDNKKIIDIYNDLGLDSLLIYETDSVDLIFDKIHSCNLTLTRKKLSKIFEKESEKNIEKFRLIFDNLRI